MIKRTSFKRFALLVFTSITAHLVSAAVPSDTSSMANALAQAKESHHKIMPVAIIGSGPAGLGAAIYTSRAGIPTFVITGDSNGGHLNDIKQIENWPAMPRTSGADIAKRLQEQAMSFGTKIIDDTVTNVNFKTYPFEITLGSEEVVNAFAVVIATGFMQEKLDIPGTEKYWGNGIGLCTICDAPFARGQDVVVVGDDDFAAERVIQLAEYANNVIMITRKNKLSVTAATVGYLNELKNAELITHHEVLEVQGDGEKVTGVKLRNIADQTERVIPVSTVYLNSVYKPESKLFKDQVPLDAEGYIEREKDAQQTLVPGIFAAGAVTNKPNKAGPSAGFGMAAGVEVIEFMHKTVGFNTTTAKDIEGNYYKRPVKRVISNIDSVTSSRQMVDQFKKNQITVLFAYSPVCQLCKAAYADIMDVAQELSDKVTFAKVNGEEDTELGRSLIIDNFPTLFIYKDGVLIKTVSDKINKNALFNMLRGILNKESAPKKEVAAPAQPEAAEQD